MNKLMPDQKKVFPKAHILFSVPKHKKKETSGAGRKSEENEKSTECDKKGHKHKDRETPEDTKRSPPTTLITL